jgi:alpha-beta hydrolase superfamily lysophospholipase
VSGRGLRTTEHPAERPRHRVEREAYGIVYAENAAFKDTYGGVEGIVFLESYRLAPAGVDSNTVLLFMHPVGGGAYLPMVNELAKQGNHVIYTNSRYRGVDAALIMEKVVLDLAAAVRDARERFGYERVVLAGWSGGGPLSLFYQQQATRPTVTCTPAGDPPSLVEAELIPADAMLLLAAHPSRHRVLCDCIDAAVLDEADPTARNPDLDLYDPRNAPPYGPEFLAAYSAAQAARVRRITDSVRARLEQLRADGRPHDEFAFVVHGTLADPRALDPAVDPNGREPGTSFLGDPRIVNNGPVGLARFSTLRSWLSQWSLDDANADGVRAAADIDVPVLQISNGADNICTPRYAEMVFDAIASPDKQTHLIDGANHYYIGPDQRPHLTAAAGICTDWLAARGLTAAPVAV